MVRIWGWAINRNKTRNRSQNLWVDPRASAIETFWKNMVAYMNFLAQTKPARASFGVIIFALAIFAKVSAWAFLPKRSWWQRFRCHLFHKFALRQISRVNKYPASQKRKIGVEPLLMAKSQEIIAFHFCCTEGVLEKDPADIILHIDGGQVYGSAFRRCPRACGNCQ